jgi:putative ABC transport system substrate-binding protein
MPKSGSFGSVRGVRSNAHSYRDSTASMTVRCVIMAFVVGTVLGSRTAHADQSATVPRIGALIYPNPPVEEGLREGLRDLGYIEGKSIVIEWRYARTEEELHSAATELAHSKPDVIVVFGTPIARAALEATKIIPVVFSAGDPVATGLAASLGKPGGNATGLSLIFTELTAKRLEFLRSLAPGARRIGCLINPANPVGALQFEEAQKAARTLGLQLLKLDARNAGELDAVLRALPRSGAHAVLITGDGLFYMNRTKIAEATRKAKLPAMAPSKEYQIDGLLVSYGPSLKETARKMAAYVDKILKGAKPADLPIEQISNYELVINLRVARAMGLKVPQELLLRADEVIR